MDQLRWHRTTLDGREAFFGDVGDGPPVVFLHGWGLTSRAYSDGIEQLARAGTRVIAPALPGFGSSAPLEGALTWERLAWWTRQLLEHAGVDEPAFFIGHSFGGAVATATAWFHPELARSLTLVNAVGGAVWKPSDDEDGPHRHLHERPIWSWGLHLPREFGRREYRRVLPVVARDFLGNALFNLPALRRAAHLARTADLREELTELAEQGLPVTILWGDQDNVVPEAAFLATCDAAGAAGDIVAGDHSWLLADPEGFGELMTNSLTVHAMLDRRRRRTAGDAA